jgi:small acid-soluble spore protein (thioredoxin-like protein)
MAGAWVMKGKHQRDTGDNVRKTKNNIDRTFKNMEAAAELISKTDSDRVKNELEVDNQNRQQAIDKMHAVVKEDAKHHKP